MREDVPYGIAAWSSDSWRESALAWLDERLAGAGIERRGEAEQTHLRPWATVFRVPTAGGTVWFKAAATATAFEVPLYALLARTVPEHVLTPIATEPDRGWVLLPDGGSPIGERLEGRRLLDALVPALVQYGELQRTLEPHVEEMLAAGVADMRPVAMPRRLGEALEAVAAEAARAGDEEGNAIYGRVAAIAPRFEAWCERLAASPVPPSLDHNDLHPWNILGDGSEARYYDWGDSVLAHPFAAMLVPLGFVQRLLGTASLDDPRYLRARDAYLDVFADVAPREELAGTLALACRVAKVARVLTWERALRAAREQGEPIDDYFRTAPRDTLASVLDESYLGGG